MSPDDDEAAFEAEVRALLEAGAVAAATERVLRRHGARFHGYIASIVRDPTRAADAFQLFSLRLWRDLEAFRWESALRTWAYRIARNASYRTLEDAFHKRGRRLATEEAERVAAWTRTATDAWRRTAEKERLWALIADLAEDERELLTLRLGRQMSWLEIAAIMHDDAAPPDPKTLRRQAATLRKRYERLKEHLKARFPSE